MKFAKIDVAVLSERLKQMLDRWGALVAAIYGVALLAVFAIVGSRIQPILDRIAGMSLPGLIVFFAQMGVIWALVVVPFLLSFFMFSISAYLFYDKWEAHRQSNIADA